jgi:hypothetical protein
MFLKKQFFFLYFLLLCGTICHAQIEVARVSLKDFKAIGFGGFLNFSLPVSEANFVTLEGGLQYFKNKYDEDLALVPVLLGYRYTLNQSGTGLYIEPNAGYTFGASTIQVYDEVGSPMGDNNGNYLYHKIAGPTAGIGIGYLLEAGRRTQFNLGLRYEHGFGQTATNVFALRFSHAFTFGRRRE